MEKEIKIEAMSEETPTASTGAKSKTLEERILELCATSGVGINDKVLQVAIPDCTVTQRVTALNQLIAQEKIELLKQGNELLYKAKDQSKSGQVKGGDNEEKLVYQIIAKAENKGIWIRDIRYQSNLSLTFVNKVVKSLESKKLIKFIKPVNASKKKVYMLYDLEPDCSVTGGSWYSDQEFETEFVDVLNQQCYRYLQQASLAAKEKKLDVLSERNASYKSSKDIWKFIKELKISKVELSFEDIESILNTLIYDGKVERTTNNNSDNLYRVLNPLSAPAPLMAVPCGICPLVKDCHLGGEISPINCKYIQDWLKE